MAEVSGASLVPDLNRFFTNFNQARGQLQSGEQQDIVNQQNLRKLELLEEIQRGNLGVSQGNLAVNQRGIDLKELLRTDDIGAQQKIKDVLSQQFGTGGVTTPLQSVLDTEKSLASGLIGIKGGLQVFNSLQPILERGREDELLAAKQEIEDTQRFALKVDRGKTRAVKNRIIDQRQSQLIQDTGRIDPDLQAMRNMSDDDLEAEILTDLAQGDSLKKLVDNRLVPPKPTKPVDKFEDVLDSDGKVIAQKNVTTGEVKKSPLAETTTEEKAGVHSLPDGSKITDNSLRAQYRLQNELIDPLDLKILSKTDPERASIEREKIRTALPFDKWAKQNFGIDIRGGFKQEDEIEASPVSLPETKAGLVRGRIYQTARGPASWDGKQFIPVGEK